MTYPNTHPTDEELECYLLSRLSETESERIEAHLLPCDHCLNRVEGMEENLLCLKAALSEVAAVGASPGKSLSAHL